MHQILHQYFQNFNNAMIDRGLDPYYADMLSVLINAAFLIIALMLLDRILRKVVLEFFRAFTNKTKSTFDDYLVLTNFPRYVAHIIPINIFKYVMAIMLHGSYPLILEWTNKAINVYVIILVLKILRSVLRTTRNFFETKEKYHDKPLQSYVQVTMLFMWSLAAFFIILEIFDKEAGKNF